MPDWDSIRALYPALGRWTFLNTATFGQLSTRSEQAVLDHFARRRELACADFLDWFDDHDRLRGKLARLIHAAADDIAFFPNASTALGVLVHGLGLSPDDEVLTLGHEFPNQIYAPLFAGARLVEAPPERLPESFTPRTRLVAISSVNYTNGYRAPLGEIAAECRRRGIPLYVDGTQHAGALEFDFGRIAPDMFAVNCYKWMLAPNGIAFAAVHARLRERLKPLAIGWRSHHDWRNVSALWHGKPELKESAEKYEGGMLPSALLYALEASVDLMLELGPPVIEQRVLELARHARRLFPQALPFEDSPIIAAPVPDAAGAAARLKERRILVSARHGLLRVSTHFYNNEADIARLAEAMEGTA
ncbi:MAG: aminotransferase class V-fold PLP-dependent enzyme [Bryobacteraceae bacterium]|nr:aminotransferase class V-fold PLP-dependent enzyme [Bryobacteraceae bacterium]